MSLSSAASKPWSANSSLFARFFERALPALRRFGEAPAMLAVREALLWSAIGLGAGLLAFLALVPVHGPFLSGLPARISRAELPAFGVMACALAAVLPYRLALHLRYSRPLLTAAGLAAFALALPQPLAFSQPLTYLARVGQSGLFLALIAGLLLAGLCCAARVRYAGIQGDAIGCAALLASAAALLAMHVSLGNALIGALAPLGRLGDSYAALMLIVLVETLLWLVGVHGPAALAAIVTPVYLALQQQNAAAYAHHLPLPHIVVVSLFLFVFPGGAGATLPLAALLACSKIARLRALGRVTFVPALFNFNEPLIFGLPLVLNPYLAVPFVLSPLILATLTYWTLAMGWVARPALWIPSSLPAFVSTYLATLDPRAIALLCVNLAVAALIYWPFVRAYERSRQPA